MHNIMQIMHKKIKINNGLTGTMFDAILFNKGRDKPLHLSNFYFFKHLINRSTKPFHLRAFCEKTMFFEQEVW